MATKDALVEWLRLEVTVYLIMYSVLGDHDNNEPIEGKDNKVWIRSGTEYLTL